MGGMAHAQFRFERPVTERAIRDALRAEVGRSRSSARAIDIYVQAIDAPQPDVAYRAAESIVTIESMDLIAWVYAEKVCLALGGVRVRPRERPLPEWTATPWRKLGVLRRLRLWIGPTRL